MKGIKKRLVMFCMTMMMILSTSLTAFAAQNPLEDVCNQLAAYENSSNTGEKNAYEEACNVWSGFNDSPVNAGVAPAVEVTFNNKTVKFHNTTTDVSSSTTDTNYVNAYTAMNNSLNAVSGSSTDRKTVEGATADINAMVDTLNAESNIADGAKALESIMPLVNNVTGIIIIIVLLGLAVFTALDVAYLVFPVAKQQMDSAGQSGKASVSKTDKNGEAKFRWVSDDAIQAYQQATETGKHPMMTYLKARLVSYIAVAIVVFMLMSGNLGVIINFILGMLASLFDMFGNLATNANVA